MASWNDFLFGSKESRAKSKQVLKEMRPTYERPKLGGRKSVSAPKDPNAGIGVAAKRNPTPKNPNVGIGKDQSRVPRKDQPRIKPEPSLSAIDIRGYFGDERTGVRKPVAGFAAKPKQATPSVVRTTVDMKTSPVKTAPIKTAVSPKETSMSRAQRIVAERQAAGPRMAGGKNVSYGFGSAKALGQSIAKSFGGGGQRSGGGMGGGMRSGGGRATDPSRGGMGNSGRGTGSKK